MVKLTIYPETRSDRYLITLDRPATVSGLRHWRKEDDVFIAKAALDHPYRLDQLSHPEADLQVSGPINRSFYLRPPEQVSARMQDVASGISRGATSERLANLAEFFRNQQILYAQDKLPDGPDPIDDFLFDAKRGYCEFFASAYVTLARLAEIPARLVGGYYGGEYNQFGGYYLVTEDTAHVWVEVLTDDNRWVRIDPSQWAINASSALNNRRVASMDALQRLVDSLNYRWVQTVLLFDFSSQVNFLRDARDQLRTIRPPKIDVRQGLWLGGLIIAFIAVVLLLRTKRLSPDARLLEEFRTRVRKRYGRNVVSPAIGLAELGERLDDDQCREFARIYQGAIFRDRLLHASERVRLKELLKKI